MLSVSLTIVSELKVTTFQRDILPLPNNRLEKFTIALVSFCLYSLIREKNFQEHARNYLYKLLLILNKIGLDLLPFGWHKFPMACGNEEEVLTQEVKPTLHKKARGLKFETSDLTSTNIPSSIHELVIFPTSFIQYVIS